MSALPPKADICSAPAHIRYGPKADIATWIFYWRGAPVRVLSLCRDSAIIFGDQFSAPLKNWEALLRVSFLTALVVFAPISLCADPASAGAFDAVFGTRHPYEGPWCAYMNTGAGRVEEDCTVESLARCRQMVLSGNRGFCAQNPAFVGSSENPIRKKKR
jgi:hypothetical protein